MAEKILNTRIQLKYDELSSWNNSTIGLKKGEIAIATVSAAAGKELTEPVIMMKVGEDGVKTFSQLPWALHAKASDVYGWAKQTSAQFVDSFLAMVGADGTTMQAKLDGIFATDQALADAVSALEKKITDLSVAAIEGRVKALEDYKATHGDIVTHNASEFAPADIDTGVHAVALTSGTNNGTLKLTVDGVDEDNIAVKGLGSAAFTDTTAYATAAQGTKADNAAVKSEVDTALAGKADKSVVEAMYTNDQIDGLLATKQDTIPANTYDAYGAAADVLGTSSDAATANTVYGAKAAAAAAQSDATTAKTKIEAFLDTVTPDGSADIIDTLTEINNYVGEHGEEFAALSEKVTKIEDGTTATKAGDLTAELEAEIKGYTVANATKAADADKLGGQDPSYYATATSVTDITKDNGAIDAKIAAYNTSKSFGDIITHNVAEFATAAQGTNADTAYGWGDHSQAGYAKTADLGELATKDSLTAADVGAATAGDITTAIEALDSSVAATAADGDKVSVLTGVTQADGKLTDKTEVKLAAIAKTGNVNDLIQTEGDVLVFNCGTATLVI